jgi:hypothetical protein
MCKDFDYVDFMTLFLAVENSARGCIGLTRTAQFVYNQDICVRVCFLDMICRRQAKNYCPYYNNIMLSHDFPSSYFNASGRCINLARKSVLDI